MYGIKYRPVKFEEVVGQPKVVKGLQNFLIKDSFPQATALIGNSGCGKSTLARIIAMALNCEHPIIKDGKYEPCGCCSSCKDIIEERYSRGTTIYNGSDVTIDKIREIEEALHYSSMLSKNNIVIFEEAQLIPSVSFRSLLTLLESAKKNTYFILTSTDKAKFSNSYGKDNKSQETNALRSRLSMFSINGITTDEISDYLFGLLEKIDPDEKLPNELVESIPFIAQSAKNNLRNALNSFEQAITCEIYDKEGLINLLGLMDDEKESLQVIKMLNKDPSAFTYMQESKDLAGNVPYWAKILVDARIREVTKIPYSEQWKENSAKQMMATGNIASLLDAFTKSSSLCGAYFNPTIFYSCICEYYSGDRPIKTVGYIADTNNVQPSTTITTTATVTKPIVKKVKKVAKV